MSKDKPEVGDIYQDEYGDKILVTNLWDFNNENSHTDCISEDCRNNPFYLKVRHIALKDFKFLTYIGKSTTENKDLFKTENEQKIKIGQIYKSSATDTIRVVTSIGYDTVITIDTYGDCDEWIYNNLINYYKWKLIAEYPTWQEAVNSPEFKGEK